MTPEELQTILLVEVHKNIQEASAQAVGKLGKPVPPEAIDGYLTKSDIEQASKAGMRAFDHPAVEKCNRASRMRISTLAYPLNSPITQEDAQALESLVLTDAQSRVLQRVVAEAIENAFFHFFCLIDGVGDPELTPLSNWIGVRLVYRDPDEDYDEDEPMSMYHDEIHAAFDEFQRRTRN
jgi:hypothetical protein